jgi:hypothetical protein
MITVVYGVPGSGKTYYAVHWIKRRCLESSDVFFRVRSDVLLITNLALRLDSNENYIYLEDFHDFAKYMDVDFWKANFHLLQGRKVVFVVDECQRFFYFYGSDVKVLYFLQYHRHLGMDILLITQTPKSLPAKVFELSEFLIEAVPKSVNPFAFLAFRYRVLHPFDRSVVLRRFHLAFDPAVFYLYEDMIYSPEEGEERPANAFIRYYVMLGGIVLALVVLIYLFFSVFLSPPVPSQTDVSSTVSSPANLTYEDLITEVEEESKELSPDPVPLGPPQEKPLDVDVPKDEPKGYGYIVIEVARPSVRSSGGSGLDLSGPKVVELP